VWTQKCAVQKASVDVNISYYQLKKKKFMDTGTTNAVVDTIGKMGAVMLF
jgi:hypothetical protein